MRVIRLKGMRIQNKQLWKRRVQLLAFHFTPLVLVYGVGSWNEGQLLSLRYLVHPPPLLPLLLLLTYLGYSTIIVVLDGRILPNEASSGTEVLKRFVLLVAMMTAVTFGLFFILFFGLLDFWPSTT